MDQRTCSDDCPWIGGNLLLPIDLLLIISVEADHEDTKPSSLADNLIRGSTGHLTEWIMGHSDSGEDLGWQVVSRADVVFGNDIPAVEINCGKSASEVARVDHPVHDGWRRDRVPSKRHVPSEMEILEVLGVNLARIISCGVMIEIDHEHIFRLSAVTRAAVTAIRATA